MFKTIEIGIAFSPARRLLRVIFESNPYYHIESNGKALLIFNRERSAGDKEIKTLLDFGKRLKSAIIAE